MAFLKAVLNEHVDYGFEGGAEYETEIVPLENGFEHADTAWQYARHRYSASFANLDEDSRDYIINVFHVCRGRTHAFKFRDWNDYKIEGQPLQVPVGTLLPVQLYKRYAFGEGYTIRLIQAVEEAVIYDPDGIAVNGQLDFETGIFTPANAWQVGEYTLDALFYVWTRFDSDYNSMTINSWQSHTAKVDLYERKRALPPEVLPHLPQSWNG